MSPHSSSAPAISSEVPVATGFDFQPLPTGDVLIQFFADDGKSINTQIMTKESLARLPVAVHAFFLAVEEGKEAALAFFDGLAAAEGKRDAR